MKQLRRRLIAGAMIALTILLILIIGCIVVLGHTQMENDTDSFIDRTLNEMPPRPRESGPPIFGYQPESRSAPAGYIDLLIQPDGQIIRQNAFGILEQDDADIEAMVQQILREEKTRGKLGVYKYGKANLKDVTRIILLDNAIQIQAIYSILRSAAIVGCACLLLMFIILQPIAYCIAKASVASQERERQFITNASHELKTPVAVIQSNIEAMEMMEGENKWSRNIHHQVLRLNHMIAQLLLVERIGEQRQKLEAIDLGELIRTVSQEMSELMEQRELKLTVQCDRAQWIKGNEEALTQLLRILLDNAGRYASRDSQILLSLTPIKKDLALTCENLVDTLPDCPPEQLLERFHRGGIMRQPGDLGCGIGLSAAADITAMHRGRITVTYPDEHTFRVTVLIPV